MWKNVHPVYGAGIQTHDLWNMSLFLQTTRPGLLPKQVKILIHRLLEHQQNKLDRFVCYGDVGCSYLEWSSLFLHPLTWECETQTGADLI